MSNPDKTVLYVGVTNDIRRRVLEHKNRGGGVFTREYNCVLLVHYEEYPNIKTAIAREKNIKNWKRKWKEELVDRTNPKRKDLSIDWY